MARLQAEAALTDLGFVRYDGDAFDNNYGGGWTGKYGVRSANDFLNDRRAQDEAAQEWIELMWHYIELQNLDNYAWSEVGDVTLTPSGMLAATYLLGPDSLAEFIHSNGQADLLDPYGTSIQSYMISLSEFSIPFAPDAPASLKLAAEQ